MSEFNIIFYGTPDFAIPSLKILLENTFKICAVVTAPDRPSGRGLKMQMPAIKKFALEYDLPVLQPEKLNDINFIDQLKQLKPDLQVVVAFRKLPKSIWSLPGKGTINLHASKLPQYRGAAPINWAIINGEKQSGSTTFFINEQIDTGDLILQNTVNIDVDETAGSLHDKLSMEGANLVLETVKMIKSGKVQPKKQAHVSDLKSAPKLNRDLCKIDFSKPVQQVYNHIRGLSPYPAAWALLNGKTFKIYEAKMDYASHKRPYGEALIKNNELKIACADGFILPQKVQLEGKKRMLTEDFLRGFNFDAIKLS